MSSIRRSPDVRDEYVHLFNTCDLRPGRAAEIEASMQRVLSQQARYRQAESGSGVPWYFIAVVHQMESSGRFDRHLHNSDPLTARTRQVPAGRPPTADRRGDGGAGHAAAALAQYLSGDLREGRRLASQEDLRYLPAGHGPPSAR